MNSIIMKLTTFVTEGIKSLISRWRKLSIKKQQWLLIGGFVSYAVISIVVIINSIFNATDDMRTSCIQHTRLHLKKHGKNSALQQTCDSNISNNNKKLKR